MPRKKKSNKVTKEQDYFTRYLDKIISGTSTYKDVIDFIKEDTKATTEMINNINNSINKILEKND